MTEQISINTEDNSLKELLLNIKELTSFLMKHYKLIILISLFGGVLGFLYASNQKPTYTAKMTFVLEEAKGGASGLGGLASLAGQFGVDIGGTSGGGVLSGDNILLYFKSPSLAREVLLSPFEEKSKTSIADFYANVYGLKKIWRNDKNIGDISFPILETNRTYSLVQESLLKGIIDRINSSQFSVVRADKKAAFIDVISSMQDELLAKIYCERIVQKVVDRYISIKTQRQNATVQKLQLRVDSIANLLKQKTMSGAYLQNSTNTLDINPLYRTGTTVAVETTIRDKTLLSTIFANVTQNLEMAKFTLSQETPVIQIVDSPILPLKKVKISRIKTTLQGAFLFAFIIILLLLGRRVYFKIFKG